VIGEADFVVGSNADGSMRVCQVQPSMVSCLAASQLKVKPLAERIDMAHTRHRREYLQLLDASKVALEAAVDAYNRVWHPYRDQATLLLLSNAWELLAKAVLVQHKESIVKGHRGETISAEVAIHRLLGKKLIQQAQAETVQQIVSLRNEACHNVLPSRSKSCIIFCTTAASSSESWWQACFGVTRRT
jgi:Domain of unknown function (DUF3644)